MDRDLWPHLFKVHPTPFGNKDIAEVFWALEAWPSPKKFLNYIHGLTLIDGEKTGVESANYRNEGRSVDQDAQTPRKRLGRRLDLVGSDSIGNKN
ncbi:hypothetical protein BGX23_005007 [Mortierella sp. AD031]|nr:hypothetical protein BGX23_005007 [Mortierella sp. AD031]